MTSLVSDEFIAVQGRIRTILILLTVIGSFWLSSIIVFTVSALFILIPLGTVSLVVVGVNLVLLLILLKRLDKVTDEYDRIMDEHDKKLAMGSCSE